MIEIYNRYLNARCGLITRKPLITLLNLTMRSTKTFKTISKSCAFLSPVTTLYCGHNMAIILKVCVFEYDLNFYRGRAKLNCFEVQYEDDPTIFNSSPIIDFKTHLKTAKLGAELFKIKHANWRYEQEYRWVLPNEEIVGHKLYLNRECLRSVILSEHAPVDRKLKVLMTCQSLGIPVKHAIAQQNSFTFQAMN